MKKDNKKALYESIMTSVAKEVKKTLNEDSLLVEDDIDIRKIGYLMGVLLLNADKYIIINDDKNNNIFNNFINILRNGSDDDAKMIFKYIAQKFGHRI